MKATRWMVLGVLTLVVSCGPDDGSCPPVESDDLGSGTYVQQSTSTAELEGVLELDDLVVELDLDDDTVVATGTLDDGRSFRIEYERAPGG